MKVSLINYTPHALETLIFTKNTRLRMTARGLEEIIAWPEERKQQEWEYMKGTIQSSWEFVDYIFMIEDVTRAFTHQLVRHRVGTSFAQQAQRAVDMSGFEYLATGDKLNPEGFHIPVRQSKLRDGDPGTNPSNIYDKTMQVIDASYQALIAEGVPAQDARGILPTNILTNIAFKANLRTLHEMALKRLCVKAQGEFQDVFRAIRAEVTRVHPWTEPVLRVQCASNGTCLFPTYPVKDCPVKPYVYNHLTGRPYGYTEYGHEPGVRVPSTVDEIQLIWERNRAEAQPGLPKEVAAVDPTEAAE